MNYKLIFTNEKTIKTNLKKEVVEKIVKQIALKNKISIRVK